MAIVGSCTLPISLLVLCACAGESRHEPAATPTDERIAPPDPPTPFAVRRGPWLQSAMRASVALDLANGGRLSCRARGPGPNNVRVGVYVGESDQVIQIDLRVFVPIIVDPQQCRDGLAVQVIQDLYEIIAGSLIATGQGGRFEAYSDVVSWDAWSVELNVPIDAFQDDSRHHWRARFRWGDFRRSLGRPGTNTNPFPAMDGTLDRLVWVDGGPIDRPTDSNDVPFSLAGD